MEAAFDMALGSIDTGISLLCLYSTFPIAFAGSVTRSMPATGDSRRFERGGTKEELKGESV